MARDWWPEEIPRARAIAALELAEMVLNEEEDLEPREVEGDHEVSLVDETWAQMVELATRAVGEGNDDAR